MNALAEAAAPLAIEGHLLPTGWALATVGELFEIQQGKAMSASARSASAQFPFLRTANVLWGSLDLRAVDTMGLSAAERARLALRAGDLLVCEGGEIGRAAVWSGQLDDCYYQNHIHRLRPLKDGAVDPVFYSYWFQAAFTKLGLYGGAGTKTTIANLSRGRLAGLTIPVAPLDDQRRIARILSTIQRATATTVETIDGLDGLRKAFKADFLSNQERDADHVCLGELNCTIATGPFGSQLHASDYVESGVPVLNPTHLKANGIVDGHTPYVSPTTATRLARHRLREGDVLIPRRGDLGRYARIDTKSSGALCGTGCMIVRLDDERVNADYFATYYGSGAAQTYLRETATGTIMPNINPKILAAMPVAVPPRATQDDFVAACDAIDHLNRATERRVERLRRLFEASLHHLLGAAS